MSPTENKTNENLTAFLKAANNLTKDLESQLNNLTKDLTPDQAAAFAKNLKEVENLGLEKINKDLHEQINSFKKIINFR